MKRRGIGGSKNTTCGQMLVAVREKPWEDSRTAYLGPATGKPVSQTMSRTLRLQQVSAVMVTGNEHRYRHGQVRRSFHAALSQRRGLAIMPPTKREHQSIYHTHSPSSALHLRTSRLQHVPHNPNILRRCPAAPTHQHRPRISPLPCLRLQQPTLSPIALPLPCSRIPLLT